MKKLILLLPIILMACSTPQVTQDRYFTLVSLAIGTGQLVEIYVDACNTQPKTNQCYNKFPAINKGATLLKSTMHTADTVFIMHDATRYDIAYSTATNAAIGLRTLLQE